jgi:ribosomal protein L17
MLESAGRPSSEGRGTDKAGESCHCCCCVLVVVGRLSGHGELQGTRNVTSVRKSPSRGSLTNYFGFTASSRNPPLHDTAQHGKMGYTTHRMLGRKSSHRQALLRNLVTSLFEHESISTTYPKAKEAQQLAEKCITLAKKNTEASRNRAQEILYVRHPSTFPSARTREPPNKEALLSGGREILPRTAQNT